MGKILHNRLIYLDYHAHAPLDPRVADSLADAFQQFDANPHSTHGAGEAAHRAVETGRQQVADMLGVAPSEIIFTSGATEANNLALRGLASHFESIGRQTILVSAGEHPSVLQAAGNLAREIPLDGGGKVEPAAVAAELDAHVGLVSVAAANHEIGTVQPLDAIAERVRAAGALLHSDLAQTAGRIAVDPGCYDLASLSAHKLGGPLGIGALVVKRRLRRHLAPLIHGGGQEGGLRPGTVAAPLCVAFGEACRIAAEEMAAEGRRVAALRDALRDRLASAGGMTLHGAPDRLPGNLNFRFANVDGEALVMRLRDTVALSTGSACTSSSIEPSHVLRAIGLSDRAAEGAVRIGIGRQTSQEEIDRAGDLILAAVAALRSTVRNAA